MALLTFDLKKKTALRFCRGFLILASQPKPKQRFRLHVFLHQARGERVFETEVLVLRLKSAPLGSRPGPKPLPGSLDWRI